VIAEWNPQNYGLINFEQINGFGRIRLAEITTDYIACFDNQNGIFKVLDTNTRNIVSEFK
jgi:hypothetical protein